VIQNFSNYQTVPLTQPFSYDKPKLDGLGSPMLDPAGKGLTEKMPVKEATIPMGPVASQEAIKELGTNGGGFFNANSAHPFENPTPLSNFLEILFILLIPAALTRTFGKMVGNPKQGWALLGVMLFLFVVAFGVLHASESASTPMLYQLGVAGATWKARNSASV
jgi:K+-transporting ATPase ATPase A chain